MNALWVGFLLVKGDTCMAGVHRRPPAEQWLSSEVRSPDSAADREHVAAAAVVVVVVAAVAADDDGAGAWH